MFRTDHIISQVLENCAISDSRQAGLYSVCGLVLRMRDLYKWEKGFAPWVEEESSEFLKWIGYKEEIENRLLRPLGLGVNRTEGEEVKIK